MRDSGAFLSNARVQVSSCLVLARIVPIFDEAPIVFSAKQLGESTAPFPRTCPVSHHATRAPSTVGLVPCQLVLPRSVTNDDRARRCNGRHSVAICDRRARSAATRRQIGAARAARRRARPELALIDAGDHDQVAGERRQHVAGHQRRPPAAVQGRRQHLDDPLDDVVDDAAEVAGEAATNRCGVIRVTCRATTAICARSMPHRFAPRPECSTTWSVPSSAAGLSSRSTSPAVGGGTRRRCVHPAGAASCHALGTEPRRSRFPHPASGAARVPDRQLMEPRSDGLRVGESRWPDSARESATRSILAWRASSETPPRASATFRNAFRQPRQPALS